MNKKSFLINYFTQKGLVESNIKSFNYLIDKGLQQIVNDNKDIEPTIIPPGIENFRIRLGKISVGKPQIVEADGSKRFIYPVEARLRDITYAAPMILNINTYINDVHRESVDVNIGNLPIMIKSKNCNLYGKTKKELIELGEDPDNPGGYFIINGTEKIIIIMEDLAPNRFNVEKVSIGPSKYIGKYFGEGKGIRVPHQIEKLRDGIFYLSFSRIKRIPIVIILKALGMDRDEEIVKIMNIEDPAEVIANLYEFLDIKTREEALDFIAKKVGISQPRDIRISRIEGLIDRLLFPDIGQDSKARIWKAYQLIKIWKKYILVSNGVISTDDKDHFMNKRLKLPGELLGDLFRANLRILINDMLYNFQRIVKRGKLPSVKVIIREKLLTSRINSAMATGNWVANRTGICQRIEHLNYLQTISHLHRVVSPLSSSEENFEARSLHPTHLGRLCPTETPEGSNIGLRKNLALFANITSSVDYKEILKSLTELGLEIKVPISIPEKIEEKTEEKIKL